MKYSSLILFLVLAFNATGQQETVEPVDNSSNIYNQNREGDIDNYFVLLLPTFFDDPE